MTLPGHDLPGVGSMSMLDGGPWCSRNSQPIAQHIHLSVSPPKLWSITDYQSFSNYKHSFISKWAIFSKSMIYMFMHCVIYKVMTHF